jgi:hypothetical protein
MYNWHTLQFYKRNPQPLIQREREKEREGEIERERGRKRERGVCVEVYQLKSTFLLQPFRSSTSYLFVFIYSVLKEGIFILKKRSITLEGFLKASLLPSSIRRRDRSSSLRSLRVLS